MKKAVITTMLVVSATLLIAFDSMAQGDVTYQCCCNLQCCVTYNSFTDPFTIQEWCGPLSSGPDCTPSDILFEDLCTSDLNANWRCIEARLALKEIIRKTNQDVFIMSFDHYTGSCEFTADVKCVADSLIGADNQGLDILRQFRNQVLEKSGKGQKLADAYYHYGSELKQALNENPGLKNFAADLLGKVIVRLFAALGSKEELLTDDIAGDIEIFADALDAEVTQPELKQVIRQIKKEVRDRTLFK